MTADSGKVGAISGNIGRFGSTRHGGSRASAEIDSGCATLIEWIFGATTRLKGWRLPVTAGQSETGPTASVPTHQCSHGPMVCLRRSIHSFYSLGRPPEALRQPAKSLTKPALLTNCRQPGQPTRMFVEDGKNYWHRARELGTIIVQAHAPTLSDTEACGLLGQLNLGTGQFGKAKNAPFEADYCRWVPDAILDHLRPSYVIMLGLADLLSKSGHGFDPAGRLGINWNKPEDWFPFAAYEKSNYRFRLWRRARPDGGTVRFVLWPQHPSQAPMTNRNLWRESAREFIAHIGSESQWSAPAHPPPGSTSNIG